MEEQFKESKFNSAVSQILRLSELWILAHKFAREEDWRNYEIILERIWVELACDTPTKLIEERKGIIKKLNKIKSLKTGYKSEMGELDELHHYPKVNREVRKTLFFLKNILVEYEIFLRKNQNQQGLGKKYVDESEESID